MKLSVKIFSNTALMIVIGFMVIGGIAITYTRSIMKVQIGMDHAGLAKQLMDNIDRTLFQAYQNILLISEDEVLEEALDLEFQVEARPKIDLYEVLNEKFALTGPWDTLTAITRHGVVKESVGWEGRGENIDKYKVSGRIFHEAVKSQKGKIFYSDLVVSDQTGQPTIVFASAVFDNQRKEILGVIMGHFSWPAVLEILAVTDSHVISHLFNRQGLVIAALEEHRDGILKYRFEGNMKTLEEEIFIVATKGQISHHGGAQSAPVLAAAATQKGRLGYAGQGWILLLETRLDAIFQPINQMAMTIALYAGIFIVVFSGISLIIGRKLAKPLVSLTDMLGKVGKGDLTLRAEVTTRDEVGVLAEAFNKMLADLEDITVSRDALENSQQELKQSYEELRRAQAQLVQSSKLASIGELAAGVAHELNQPLMIIRTTAQLTLRKQRKDSLDTDYLEKKLGSIEKNTKRMMNIINHLRTFSRQTKGEFAPVNVNKIIQDSFLMIGEQLSLRNIKVIQDLSVDLPKVLGDVNQLEQVFLNLLANGRDAIESKFESQGGGDELQKKIVITTHISGDVKDEVEILFKDTGNGVPQEALNSIFDPFYTSKEVGKGTGLGLSISFGIIEDHKGNIDVAETGPGGTTFRIRLPVV